MLFGLIIVALTDCSTKKNEVTEVPDAIAHSSLDKTIGGISRDSVNISCYPVVFEIYRNNDTISHDTLSVRIVRNKSAVPDDCTRSFLCNETQGQALPLSQDEMISDAGTWGSMDGSYDLGAFRGAGEKFIGIVTETVSNNVLSKQFGWIRIRLSSKNDTLKIIDWAYNSTAYKSIKAGQVE